MTSPEVTRRILSYADLRLKGIRFSRVWIMRLVADGKFPKPLYLGEATPGFLEVEIDKWIDDKAAERTTSSSSSAS